MLKQFMQTHLARLLLSVAIIFLSASNSIFAAPLRQSVFPPDDTTIPLGSEPSWILEDIAGAELSSFAWGDVDNDGDLDLAVGHGGEQNGSLFGNFSNPAANRLYLNEEGNLSVTASWASFENEHTTSLAWGDVDNDGDLDLAVGNTELRGISTVDQGASNSLYLNEDGTLTPFAEWSSDERDDTNGIAWGDVDNDGDLDLAVANGIQSTDGGSIKIYLNENGLLASTAGWRSADSDGASSVAWGDMDNDGDLDLAVATEWVWNTDSNQATAKVYINNGTGLDPAAVWLADDASFANSVAWGDVDNDGDLDLAAGRSVYLNKGGLLERSAAWVAVLGAPTSVWGDVENDGDLDLVVGSQLYLNQIGVEWVTINEEGEPVSTWPKIGLRPLPSQNVDGELARTLVGSALVDIDGDSDLDFFSAYPDTSSRIYTNHSTPFIPSSTQRFDSSARYADDLEWVDMDGDGDLDLAAADGLRFNEAGRLSSTTQWALEEGDEVYSIAPGDVDNDGDLDLAVAVRQAYPNPAKTRLYLNDEGTVPSRLVWSLEELGGRTTTDMAWGDVDNDGDLDLAVVAASSRYEEELGGHTSKVFINEDGMLALTPSWNAIQRIATYCVAWGDVDNDGDLDLAIGTERAAIVYRNDGGTLTQTEMWRSAEQEPVYRIAWGDLDNDGDLDLATSSVKDRVYLNENGTLAAGSDWSAYNPENGFSKYGLPKLNLTWIDIDNDSDLDLISGDKFYANDNGALATSISWLTDFNGTPSNTSIAWGDIDQDGDLDAAVDLLDTTYVYLNARKTTNILERPSSIHIDLHKAPGVVASGTRYYSSAAINQTGVITIPYTIAHQLDQPLREIKAYYSLNGGGKWEPAVGTQNIMETAEPTSVTPTGEHALYFPIMGGQLQPRTSTTEGVFYWDVIGSGFVGQSDNVIVRLEAHFICVNSCQRTHAASQTFPMRVRGTQVQVLQADSGEPATNALVYRLSDEQTREALPFADGRGVPLQTDGQGYLQGRGEINAGDRLIALYPVPLADSNGGTTHSDERVRLYHTSAAPTATGLEFDVTTGLGMQQLEVSANNPLMVFDLDVALEWDARNDPDYLNNLEADLRRTSELIYDWTNGQAALGQITIYQNKEKWQEADVRIHATNSLRPYATIGGRTPNIQVEEIPALQAGSTERTYQLYGPGHVDMGVVWNRYGKAGENLGEDWARTLAHELGHYLFYLHDNYLGIDDGRIIRVDDCPGVMSNPYNELISEFHPAEAWQPNCTPTLSHQLVGRSDWESIQNFYPWLQAPTGAIDDAAHAGPNLLPLALTNIAFDPIEAESTAIDVPIFYLGNADGSPYIASSRSQAVLLQGDSMIDLGTPQRDRINAYNARTGDLLCIYDLAASPVPLTGCETIARGDDELLLSAQPEWQPEIIITPVSSRTVSIGVYNVPADLVLHARIYPARISPTSPAPEAIVLTFDGGSYRGSFTLGQLTLAAHIHLYDAIDPQRGVLTHYSLGGAPMLELKDGDTLVLGDGGGTRMLTDSDSLVVNNNGITLVMGDGGGTLVMGNGDTLVMGDGGGTLVMGDGGGTIVMSNGQAPVRSSDGQVVLYGEQLHAQPDQFFALQPATILPSPLLWAEMVGPAYRVTATPNAPDIAGAFISFNYLGRNINEEDEPLLRIYFWDDSEWSELETTVDVEHNIAVAEAQGIGVYALMYSVDIALQPLPNSQWDLFGYPINDSRPVDNALLSLSGHYTAVYHYDAVASMTPWKMYRTDVPEWVNDLVTLEFGELYWINLSQAMTLRLYPNAPAVQSASSNPYPAPPATFYGLLQSSETFIPQADMEIVAWIDGAVCGRGDLLGNVLGEDGNFAYRIHVASISEIGGCGEDGKEILFEIVGQGATAVAMWDNSSVNDLVLQPNVTVRSQAVVAAGMVVRDEADELTGSRENTSSIDIYLPVITR